MHNKKALSDLFRQGFFLRHYGGFFEKKPGKKLYEEGGFGDC